MTSTLFITGTDTGVGKTVLTMLLAEFLRSRSLRVAALKPICSGGREDARRLHSALGGALPLDQINPWHFRAAIAPLLAARKERKRVTLARVLAHLRKVRPPFEVVLVEGAGGLLSPLGAGFNSRDLIAALAATPIVVAPNQLGVVNHILLTLEALPEALRHQARVVLVSPPKPDSAMASNARLLRQLSVKNICPLPWFGPGFLASEVWQSPPVRKTLAKLVD
jgi:dethiobiotin synthetase